MPAQCDVYDCLLSCPGDVLAYLPRLEEAVSSFNNHFGRMNNIVLRMIHWSKNSYPQMGAHPQAMLNQQIVNNADMLIGLFWTRFGTPTPDYGSGTEEEIERLLAQNKPVLLYFLDIPVSPSTIDLAQYQRVLAFREKYKNNGIYWVIESSDLLPQKIREHLELYFNSLICAPTVKAKGKRRILWVDDRPENNIYERKMLEIYGFDISLALSTDQAIDSMKTNRYALIISDMGRKEGPQEGYVLLDKVRKMNQTIPFIFYAGSRHPDHVQQSIARGAQGCTNIATELVDLVLRNVIESN